MRKIRVYADNSVFSGTQDEEFAEASKRFLDCVQRGSFVVLVSQVTLDELARAPEKARQAFAELPTGGVEEVRLDDEVNELAQAYIDAGVLGSRRIADAVQVAAATVARADLMLSWNFRHLVNFKRIQKFRRGERPQGLRTDRNPQPSGDQLWEREPRRLTVSR